MTARQRFRQIASWWSSVVPMLFRRFPFLIGLFRSLIGRGRRIIVFGGHGGEAFDDNGRALALHFLADPAYRVFWVYTKSPVRSAVRRHPRLTALLRFLPWTEIVVTSAHAVCFSHGFSDVSGPDVSVCPWRVALYLGHGVWGFKRIERREASEGTKSFTATITASPVEQALKSEVLRVAPGKILLTGMPKHDALVRNTAVVRPDQPFRVVYGPTWRDWLQHKPSDRAVELYLSGFRQLAESKPLAAPDGRPLELVALVHKNVFDLQRRVEEECRRYGVKAILTRNTDVNELLRMADGLITDYSALFWDVLAQGKPVVRFVIDEPIYEALTGSYPSIENLTQPLTYTTSKGAWDALLDRAAQDKARTLAAELLPLADGKASGRVTLELETLMSKAAVR